MLISVKADESLADDLLRATPTMPQTIKILGMLGTHQAGLRPTFPGIDDPDLKSHFSVEVDDAKEAASICRQLKSAGGIEAAYVKPDAEPAG